MLFKMVVTRDCHVRCRGRCPVLILSAQSCTFSRIYSNCALLLPSGARRTPRVRCASSTGSRVRGLTIPSQSLTYSVAGVSSIVA